jgi:hypothetical protein
MKKAPPETPHEPGFSSLSEQSRVRFSWYGFGAVAAVWIIYNTFTANRHVMPALKAGWPIIALFFSVIGLLLYLASCWPPGIGQKHGEEAKQAYTGFVADRWKKVLGSVIHCVGGDGLGIISAMVVTRCWA